jgi:hypothetical protein
MKKCSQIDPNLSVIRNSRSVNNFINEVESILLDPQKEPDLITYYSSGIFEAYLKLAHYMVKQFKKAEAKNLDILHYLYFNEYRIFFNAIGEHIEYYLKRVENTFVNELTYLDVDPNILSVLGIDKTNLIDYPMETHIENVSRFKQYLVSLVRNDKQLVKIVMEKVNTDIFDLSDEDKLQLLFSGFRKFVKKDNNLIYDQARAQALKFKKNRQELLSKQHWAQLADFEDMVINDFLKGEKINKSSYEDMFSPFIVQIDKEEFKRTLYLLQETTDPEMLYDFKRAYYAYDLLDRLEKHSLDFFYHMVHRQNLIKCQLFDHLKVEYDKFINEENEQDSNVAHNPDGVKKWVDEIVGKTKVLLPKMSLTEVQYEKLWTKICSEDWAIKELSKYEPRTQKWGNIKFVASVLCLLQNTLVDPRDKTGKMMLDANAYEIGRALGNEKYRAYVTQEYLSKERRNQIKVFLPYIV